jgi:hypothetical protein
MMDFFQDCTISLSLGQTVRLTGQGLIGVLAAVILIGIAIYFAREVPTFR